MAAKQPTRFRPPSADKLMAQIAGQKNLVPVRTGRRSGTIQTVEPYPRMPATWTGTLPEWAIYWAHLFLGLKPGQDFQYQYGLGATGAILDFFEFGLEMGINIQGLYYHYGFGAAKQVSDQEQAIRIEALGIVFVAIDEDDAVADPVYFLREALKGHDYSLKGLGAV